MRFAVGHRLDAEFVTINGVATHLSILACDDNAGSIPIHRVFVQLRAGPRDADPGELIVIDLIPGHDRTRSIAPNPFAVVEHNVANETWPVIEGFKTSAKIDSSADVAVNHVVDKPDVV